MRRRPAAPKLSNAQVVTIPTAWLATPRFLAAAAVQ
jgi:hypothetical protein